MKTPRPARPRPERRLAPLLALIAMALIVAAHVALDVGALLTLDTLKARAAELRAAYQDAPLAVVAGYAGTYVLVTALSLPGAAVLTLAGGALFGTFIGTAVVSVASTLGATAAFLAARFLFRDWVQERFGARLKPVNEGMRRDGAFYLLTLRLIPAFPFWMVNLLMALTPIRAGVYALVSQVGMLPGTVVYVNAGTQLARIETPRDVLSPEILLSFALLGIFPLIARALVARYRDRRALRGFRKPGRFDYNLAVVGAGSGGLVSAYIAAAVRARVLLIEKHRMGGDCLNTGCVPSKALLRSARALAEIRRHRELGFTHAEVRFDFAQVMERVQRVIRAIEPHDSVERYRGLGVECERGFAQVKSPWEVEIDGRVVTARNIVLATGARPVVPALPGLEGAPFSTSDTVWELRSLPARLAVLGSGPVGCELAQAFRRFGSEVTIIEKAPRVLSREDEDVSNTVRARLEEEGVTVLASHEALRVERTAEGGFALVCRGPEGVEREVRFDHLLLALGRKPNVEGYGLEELGVRIAPAGTIEVDDYLRTSIPTIYAVGDVAGPYQLTHAAAHQAWYAAVNALFSPLKRFRADYRVMPWCTYTDPEVARVGLNEAEARERGIAYEVTRYGIDDLDRAIAEEAAHGFVKILTAPGKDRVLGATIVGPHAGELITEFVTAMKHGIGLDKILGTIHVYPTFSEANKFAAGNWKKANKPERALEWVARFHSWRRG